jgi:acyl-CoA hydrolase
MPFTGGDAVLACEEIDYAVEADEPLASPVHRAVGEVHGEIGGRVAALVPEGATLQLGIGAVPDAVLATLTGRRGLGVWSEMFSDGVLDLERAGALDPDTPVTASFVFGSAELYAWVDRNPRVRLLRTEKTNDPGLIAEHLYAQANASRVRGVIYSGFGGQTDFVVGALHSPGGRAIIALPSWHPKADVSTVVPRLAGPVTSFQHSYVVSEQGTATVWGHDAGEQAAQIIDNVAHPDAREGLRAAGRDLGFPL